LRDEITRGVSGTAAQSPDLDGCYTKAIACVAR
jgi:hypothetical protein